MGDWIDFVEIRERVRLESVLLGMFGLGERLKRSGRKLIGPCPIHGGDSPRAFQADLEKDAWYCHTGCRRGGNVIDFVSAMEKLPVREAALKLQAAFLGSPPADGPSAPAPPASRSDAPSAAAPPGRSASPKEDSAPNPPLSLKLALSHDHPHLLKERCLSLETARLFGVGYCAKGLLRGTIAIPIRDAEGTLVAYAGRRLKFAAVEAEGKYRFPKGFRRELVLYNLDRAAPLSKGRSLVVVKGFFSVMRLHQAGIPNAVAAMGASLSAEQADLLAAAGRPVTLLFDGGEAGRAGAEESRARLALRVPARVVRLPDGLEPEGLPAIALRWAVNGTEALGLSELSFGFLAPPEPDPKVPAPAGAPE